MKSVNDKLEQIVWHFGMAIDYDRRIMFRIPFGDISAFITEIIDNKNGLL